MREERALPRAGDRSVAQRARVLENGLRLAKAAGAGIGSASRFAVFCDAKRVTEISAAATSRQAEWGESRGRWIRLWHLVDAGAVALALERLYQIGW